MCSSLVRWNHSCGLQLSSFGSWVRSFGPRHSKLLESSAGGFPLVSLVVLCLAFCLEPYLSVPFVFAAGHLCQLACCPPSAASGFGIVWLQPALFGTNCQLPGGEWNSALGSGNITVHEWDPCLCARLCDHPFPNKCARASRGARTWPEHCWCCWTGCSGRLRPCTSLWSDRRSSGCWCRVLGWFCISRGWVGCDWTFGGFCIPIVSHHLSRWIGSSSTTLFGSILLSSWFAARRSGLDSTGSASSCLSRWSCSASCPPRFVYKQVISPGFNRRIKNTVYIVARCRQFPGGFYTRDFQIYHDQLIQGDSLEEGSVSHGFPTLIEGEVFLRGCQFRRWPPELTLASWVLRISVRRSDRWAPLAFCPLQFW